MKVNIHRYYRNRLGTSLCLILLIIMGIPSLRAKTQLTEQQPETWVTVFVHGIMSIKPHLNMGNFMRLMKDDVENTVYSKTVENMRNDSYFYLNQAMQGFGLKKIDTNNIQKNNATNAIARIYDEIDHLNGGIPKDNHYYTFGWSGLMSPTIRYRDAEKLFVTLVHELEHFWRQGITPKVRLIGYSHGANLCLNIAAVRQDTFPLSKLTINELILIGLPVQTETDFLVSDQLFEKIYHVYSAADRIQPIDFFSFNRIFSRRHFKNRYQFKVPDNLMQIQFKLVREVDSKKYNNEKRHQLTMDFDNPGIISGTSRLLRDASPGHIEFWFFGWSPQNYRDNFTLNPLPAFIVLPYVLHHIQQVEDQLINPHPVIVDIRPEHEIMLIKQRKRNKFTKIVPFISKQELARLSDIAYQTQPDNFDAEEYNDRIQVALQQAKDFYEVNKPVATHKKMHKRNSRMRKRRLR